MLAFDYTGLMLPDIKICFRFQLGFEAMFPWAVTIERFASKANTICFIPSQFCNVRNAQYADYAVESELIADSKCSICVGHMYALLE